MGEKEDKIREIKKTKKKVVVVNSYFEIFTLGSRLSESIERLKMQMSGNEALDLRRFIKTITESPECKAYEELKYEIIQKFMKEQEKKPEKERLPPFSLNVPEWFKLMAMDSKLEIEKYEINVSKFPEWQDPKRIFNACDMDVLEGLFEFNG